MFEAGEDGIDTFRIPGAVRTAEGTILVVAEARTDSPHDLDPRHLVARRSEDAGATWGPILPVAPPTEEGCSQSDPMPTVAPSGDIILLFQDCEDLSLSRSTDDGATWSEPAPLPADLVDLRPGPGHGISLRSGADEGRLVVPADRPVGDESELVLLLSDDDGTTWRAGATTTTTAEGPDIDETAIAELAGGSVLVSSRNGSPDVPGRVELSSTDGGETFEIGPDGASTAVAEDLVLPIVEGSLLALPGRDEVVFASPSDPLYRRGVRLWLGSGDGTWAPGPLPVPGPAAYSDLVSLDDDEMTIGLVVETGDRNPYQRIDLIPVPVEDLDPAGPALPDDFDVSDAVAGRVVVDDQAFELTSYCLGGDRISLDGGSIELDLSPGVDAAGLRLHLDDRGDGTPLDLDGTVEVDLRNGIRVGKTLPDAEGAAHEIDLVIVNFEPCQ